MDEKSLKELEDKAFEEITFKKPAEIKIKRRGTEHGREHYEQSRPPLSLNIGSRFNISQDVKDADPDYVYGWIPIMAGGEKVQDLVDDAVERGWWPVSKREHPILSQQYLTDVYGEKSGNDDYIKKGSQMMMKRLKEHHEAECAYYENIQQHQEKISKDMIMMPNAQMNVRRIV